MNTMSEALCAWHLFTQHQRQRECDKQAFLSAIHTLNKAEFLDIYPSFSEVVMYQTTEQWDLWQPLFNLMSFEQQEELILHINSSISVGGKIFWKMLGQQYLIQNLLEKQGDLSFFQKTCAQNKHFVFKQALLYIPQSLLKKAQTELLSISFEQDRLYFFLELLDEKYQEQFNNSLSRERLECCMQMMNHRYTLSDVQKEIMDIYQLKMKPYYLYHELDRTLSDNHHHQKRKKV